MQWMESDDTSVAHGIRDAGGSAGGIVEGEQPELAAESESLIAA